MSSGHQVPRLLLLTAIGCGGSLDKFEGRTDDSDSAADTGAGSDDSAETGGEPDSATCELTLDVAAPVEDAPDCPAPSAVGDPADIELLWESEGMAVASGCPQPLVADVDRDGVGDVVCSLQRSIVVLSGTDGSVISTVRLPVLPSIDNPPIALGDLDGDGWMDVATVVVFDDGSWSMIGQAAAWNLATGEPLWRSSEHTATERGVFDGAGIGLALADLDGDGWLDVVTHGGAFRGFDGETLATFPATGGTDARWGFELLVTDLDLDGQPDILDGWLRWTAAGELIWDLRDEAPTAQAEWGVPVPVQADADPEVEVAIAGMAGITVVDTDGSVLSTLPTVGDLTLPLPCGADLDGDGLTELVFQDQGAFRALRLDGRALWTLPAVDPDGGVTQCTTFDVDADGTPEVLVKDAATLRIVAGGGSLWEWPAPSVTTWDRAMAVDLDGDGSAELVSGVQQWQDVGGPRVRVFRHRTAGWAPAPTIWPWNTWSGVGERADGSASGDLAWPGLSRGQPVEAWGADLSAEVVDACATSCEADGIVRVGVRLVNLGPDPAPAGTPLAVYATDEAGESTLLATFATSARLPAGQGTTPAWEVDLPVNQAGIVLVAGEAARGDCDPDNNTVAWAWSGCP